MVKNNTASKFISLSTGTFVQVENNVVDSALNGDDQEYAGGIYEGVETDVTIASNHAGYIHSAHNKFSTFKNNDASSEDFEYDSTDVVESNEADYTLSVKKTKSSNINRNTAAKMEFSEDSTDIIEDNAADYALTVKATQLSNITRNTATNIEFDSAVKIAVEDNAVVQNITVINSHDSNVKRNQAFTVKLEDTSAVGESDTAHDFKQNLMHFKVDSESSSDKELNDIGRTVTSAIKFLKSGVISAISNDFMSVPANKLSETAASSAQVAALAAALEAAQAEGATALEAAQTAQTSALEAAQAEGAAALEALKEQASEAFVAAWSNTTTGDAALQALITALTTTVTSLSTTVTNLTTQVTTLKSGFCPPAATGRHLLADLTPIVPPAECVKTPPAAVTNPTDIVTTTLTLSGIDLASFSTSNVAAALAATAGINVADVDVVVTDYPVSTIVSFAGVALTSLTASQISGITAAMDANLPATATPVLGAVTPAGRRLLDLSFPVTVTGVGASITLAAETQTKVTSPTTLGAAATSAGVPSSAVTATPATVSVAMTITVRAASAASAAAIATALSPANVAAITTQLAAAGVTNTGVTIVAPVLSKPAPVASSASSASISGQEKNDLLALLVLLIIPIATAAYFGGKYLERRRAAMTQEYKVHTVTVVETA